MAAARRCFTISLRTSRPLFNLDYGLQCGTITRHISPIINSSAKCSFHTSPAHWRVVKSPYPLQKFPEQNYFDFMFSKLDKHGHRVILVRNVVILKVY